MNTHLIAWIAVAALFAIAELGTMAFVAMYISLGAVAAAVIAGYGGMFAWQLLAFVLASVTLLALTRPFLKHRLEGATEMTNVHALVGKTAIVTIPIDNDANTGQIRVGTEYWTARLPDEAPSARIEVNERVRVISVEGVTARVQLVQAV